MLVDPKTVVAAAGAANKIAPKTLQEVDKFGADVLKTVRLLLAPLQLSAAWQDRLSSYIERAIRKVPEVQRITPAESITLPVAEKLRFQEESNPITELYINLLSRAMDGQRVGEAHPAFLTIISQLAPDELLFLRDVAKRDQSIIMAPSGHRIYPTAVERHDRLNELKMPAHLIEQANSMMFSYETLNQPEMFPVFQEHLQHLGLIEYFNQLDEFYQYLSGERDKTKIHWHLLSIRLTHFGHLFLKACLNEQA